MNILWITNLPIPEASLLMGEKVSPFGGWLVNAAQCLVNKDFIKLTIAFPNNKLQKVKKFNGKRISFWSFPQIDKKDIEIERKHLYLNKIINEVKPDIIHVFGTEYPHTSLVVDICNQKNIKVVISIQGLVSVIAKHYMACLPYQIQKKFTIRDLLKQDNLKLQQNKFIQRGKLEIKALKKVKYVIGRTTWDKACIDEINTRVNYYFCNEILRKEFYKYSWNIEKCEKYSIFISQGAYPIKGLHFVLEAMPLILKRYPNTKLYIAGENITKYRTLNDKLRISAYGKYIRDLIMKNALKDNIEFTGILNENEMCKRYLKSNVFLSASSIENSPNSLGEAMILGVPCVASCVGGVQDMIKDKEEGFIYPFDEPYMLAYYICNIFKNKEIALDFSIKSKKRALKTHDVKSNTETMINIYREILKSE